MRNDSWNSNAAHLANAGHTEVLPYDGSIVVGDWIEMSTVINLSLARKNISDKSKYLTLHSTLTAPERRHLYLDGTQHLLSAKVNAQILCSAGKL